MKTIEKVELSDKEHEDYNAACRALNRSMRGQTTQLIKKFLSEFYNSKKPLFKE